MNNKKIFQRTILCCFLCVVFLLDISLVISAENTDRVRQEMIEKSKEILIKNKFCSDTNDCTKKRLIFFSRKKNSSHPTLWGLHFELFEIEDKKVVLELIQLMVSEHYLNNRNIDMDFDFYRKPHREMMGLKKLYVDPFLSIDLKGVKK